MEFMYGSVRRTRRRWLIELSDKRRTCDRARRNPIVGPCAPLYSMGRHTAEMIVADISKNILDLPESVNAYLSPSFRSDEQVSSRSVHRLRCQC
jgi:hypothetical protein